MRAVPLVAKPVVSALLGRDFAGEPLRPPHYLTSHVLKVSLEPSCTDVAGSGSLRGYVSGCFGQEPLREAHRSQLGEIARVRRRGMDVHPASRGGMYATARAVSAIEASRERDRAQTPRDSPASR